MMTRKLLKRITSKSIGRCAIKPPSAGYAIYYTGKADSFFRNC